MQESWRWFYTSSTVAGTFYFPLQSRLRLNESYCCWSQITSYWLLLDSERVCLGPNQGPDVLFTYVIYCIECIKAVLGSQAYVQ